MNLEFLHSSISPEYYASLYARLCSRILRKHSEIMEKVSTKVGEADSSLKFIGSWYNTEITWSCHFHQHNKTKSKQNKSKQD